MKKRAVLYVVYAFVVLFSSLIHPIMASAKVDDYIDKFAANNIMFYDPDACAGDCRVACVGSNGSDITVIGDSILADEATKAKLKDKLSGLDTSDGNYNSVVGRHWDNGVTQARSMQLKNIVIFEHGTNNVPAIRADQLNDLLEVVGKDRTVILVTPYSATNAEYQAAYDQTAELFKQTATSNQQIKVADWAAAAKNAGVSLNDTEEHVHPVTDEERTLYVDTLTSVISGSCNSGEAIVSGATAEEKVWSGFISMGVDEYATAGIMGNIAHEGLMNPAQWQVGHEHNWGKTLREMYNIGSSNDTGMGMVAFTWYTWFDLLDNYYQETAPDLLAILEDPYTYSVADNGSHYCPGTECFLKKLDDTTANRVYSTQITFIVKSIRGDFKDVGFDYGGILGQDSPEAAADWWLENYERPACPECSRGERRGDARKFYDMFHGKSSFSGSSSGTGGVAGTNCTNNKAATAFKKYNFTDGQLRGILAIAEAENGGSLAGIKTELSIMANLFEKNGPKLGEPDNEEGFIHYIRRKPGSESGWFATYDKYDESFSSSYGNEALDAAKDILNNGNRTLPQQVLEHDCIYCGNGTYDIIETSNNGQTFDVNDRSQYKKDVTKIKNRYGSTYIFYTWADPEKGTGDPFGYFEDNPPDSSFSPSSTAAATAATTMVDIKWQDGWIISGMDGYTKGTPEMAGLDVTDSSPTLDYVTNRPIDGAMGPNKITLHSTEGYNSVGQYGLDIYAGNPYPPHFTIDMKEKKVYQHFSVDHPSAAVADVDTAAGVQIEIIGFSTEDRASDPWYLHDTQNFGDEEWQYLAKLLVGISTYTGIKLESSLKWDEPDNVRMTDENEYTNYEGVLGHMHTPKNDHTDPGNVWEKLKKAIDSVGAGVNDGGCGEKTNSWNGDFPWWAQCDDKWGSLPYGSCGGSSICDAGCGCTSFAMMATALTKVEHTPDEVCTYAGEQGMHVCGAGSSWSLPATISDHFGLEHKDLGSPSIDEINKVLREGWMVWTCGGGPDPFTEGGHCIGVRGVTSDDKWLLADSKGNGEEVTLKKEWDPNDVYPYMGTFQAIRKK